MNSVTVKKVSNILDQNAFNISESSGLNRELSTLVRRRLDTVGPTTMLFYQEPLHIVRGKGVWLYDNKGKQYLDVYNNVPSLGHCHPKIAEAVSNQIRKLNVHTRYLHETVHIYAEKLLSTMPESIDRLVMTCTGSESNDLALRLARTYTKKKGIIVSETAYHGNTSAVTEVSPSALKAQQLPDYVVTVPVDRVTQQAENANEWFAENVRLAIKTLDQRGYGCAALLVDSIFSSDGVYSDPKGFLEKAVDVVHERGGLFIADEVQPGFGRTGESMWGFQRHDTVPDIITMGKPMGNGYPVSGVATQVSLLEALCEEMGYFNTFGGSTVAAAAALAVLDTIEKEGIMKKAKQVGDYLKQGLQDLQGRYPSISEVRGSGLFLGLEFSEEGDVNRPDTAKATTVINLLRQDNVLIGGAGKFGNTLKIRPPLCFNKANADLFLRKFTKVLKDIR